MSAAVQADVETPPVVPATPTADADAGTGAGSGAGSGGWQAAAPDGAATWSGEPGRRRPALLDALVLALAVGLALLPLVPVYGARAVAPAAVGGVGLGAGIALVAAWRRWNTLVGSAVALVVYVVAGAGLAAPTLAAGGLVPTLGTTRALLRGVVTVWKEVLTLDPELGAAGSVLVAPYLLGFAGTGVAVAVARRTGRRAASWAAAVPLVVLAVAVLLGTKESVLPVAAGVTLVVVLLPWVAGVRGTLAPRRVVASLLMASVVVAGGVVGGPILGQDRTRLVLRDELVPPFDPEDHPSPLAGFRRFVKEWRETDLLTARGLPEGTPVRLATMDAFDGVVWNVAGAEAAEGSGQFRRVGETIATSVRGEPATIQFEVDRLPSVWLPTVGYTRSVEFDGPDAVDLHADLRYNDASGTAVLASGVPDGTTWTAEVVVPPVVDEDEIGAADVGSVRLPPPRGVPEAVPVFAGELAGTATSPVLIARTLEQGLVERGWFSHGLVESGEMRSLSGHGADRITTLLTADLMVGDGEQYASAMALMAREMGLPARVVLGFLPDDATEEATGDATGDATDGETPDGGILGTITFTGDDIEAWVEIEFAGYGWVPFFPTPDEAKTPEEDTPRDDAQPEPQVVQPPPPPQDPVTPPEDDTQQPQTNTPPDDRADAQTLRAVLVLVASIVGPLIVLLSPFVLIAVAKARRRRRRRAAPAPVDRVVGGWDEVLDQARDLHRPPPVLATRRETAVHLARAFAAPGTDPGSSRRAAGIGAPVAGLAAGADAMVFGPGDPTPQQVEAYWAQVDTAVRAMLASVSGARRLRARYSTASFRARRRAARATDRRGGFAGRPPRPPLRRGIPD